MFIINSHKHTSLLSHYNLQVEHFNKYIKNIYTIIYGGSRNIFTTVDILIL